MVITVSVVALAAATAITALLVVMVARAAATKPAPAPGVMDRSLLEAYAGVEDKLAALIRIPTVSRFDAAEEDEEAFSRLRRTALELFPLARDRLLRPDPGDRSMLFEWPGSDASLPPVILTAHYDVVPPGDDGLWSRPPFSGAVADG